jgi:F-type H+-transporting ATPase subunit a
MAHDPLEHVLDHKTWTFFDSLFGAPVEWDLPGFEIPGYGYFQITKFMLLELIAAVLVAAVFIPIARKVRTGALPKGPFWNLFEAFLTFVRNEIAKPNLLEDTDKYVPILWTMFIFILFSNLLGLVPLMGSPTASIFATLGLALFSLCLFHGAAIAKLGVVPYFKSLWPPIEIVPWPLPRPASHGHDHGDGHDHGHAHEPAPAAPAGPPPTGGKLVGALALWFVGWVFGTLISAMIFTIEFGSTFIKSGVLALRLFVNMFAGHVILAAILLLIVTAGEAGLTATWGLTTVISVLSQVALSLLELFVAFVQAYVFTFLTAIFLGMALHPSH